jgi:hypothetical protein
LGGVQDDRVSGRLQRRHGAGGVDAVPLADRVQYMLVDRFFAPPDLLLVPAAGAGVLGGVQVDLQIGARTTVPMSRPTMTILPPVRSRAARSWLPAPPP